MCDKKIDYLDPPTIDNKWEEDRKQFIKQICVAIGVPEKYLENRETGNFLTRLFCMQMKGI